MKRYQKCISKLVDANRALFEYLCLTCGHRWREVLKSSVTKKQYSRDACLLMDRVWRGYRRMNNVCPKCKKRIAAKLPLIGPRLPT